MKINSELIRIFGCLALMLVCGAAWATRRAPAQYVDYIDSDGLSHVDTGVVPTSRTRVVFDFQFMSAPSAAQFVLGWMGRANNLPVFTCCARADGGVMMLESNVYGNQSSSSYRKALKCDTDRHVFDLASGSQKIDNVEYATDAFPGASSGEGHTLYLFAVHNEWGSGNLNAGCRFYGCKIYEGDELIRDYRPYWDGVKGVVRDRVSGRIAEVEGVNRFRMSPPTDQREQPMREITFVDTVGGVYVDTGIVPTSTTRMVCKLQFRKVYGQLHGLQMGSDSSPEFAFGMTSQGQFFTCVASAQKNKLVTCGDADTEIHIFDLANGSQKLDGVEVATGTIGDTATETMYLFASHNLWGSDRADYYCMCRFYGCQIYDGDQLVRDYRPVGNGVTAGVRDFVTGEDCTALGGGGFDDPNKRKLDQYVDAVMPDLTQLLDTGVIPTSRTRVVYDFQFMAVPGSAQFCMGWMGGTSAQPVFTCCARTDGGVMMLESNVYGNQSSSSYRKALKCDTDRHVFDLASGSQKIDNVEYATDAFPGASSGEGHTLYLFAVHNEWGSGNLNAGCRFYGCKIYEGDELIRDYRPAIDQDGFGGVYDVLTKNFASVSGNPLICIGQPVKRGMMILVQ